MVDAKHAVFVTVKRHRLAPGFEISTGGMEIGKGRLTLDELQVHQPTRRVVDEHEQRALRATILKPPVLAAIDLHELAKAIAPAAWLMWGGQTMAAVDPQTRRDHPATQRLARDRAAVHLRQLLRRQCRTKISVSFANQRQRQITIRL